MQVKATKKSILTVAVLVTLILMFFVVSMALKLIRTGDYTKTRAVVTGIARSDSFTNYSDRQHSKVWQVEFRYEAAGAVHEGRCRTLLPFLYKEGQEINVRYDPAAPGVLRDRFAQEAGILMIVFCGAFLAVLVLFYGKAEK